MADFILNRTADATDTQPARFEYIPIVSAISEDGTIVKVKGQLNTITDAQIQKNIDTLNMELARMKTIQASMAASPSLAQPVQPVVQQIP